MIKKLLSAVALSATALLAHAQVSPGFLSGQLLTAAALNAAFAQAVAVAGGIMTGTLQVPSVLVGITGVPSAIFDVEATGAVGGSSANATLARFYAGSSTAPVTVITPTVGISRYEAINQDTEGGQNPALYVQATGNNTSGGAVIAQTAAITGTATQVGYGDAVGIFGVGTQANTATAGRYGYGGFFEANANAPGTHAFSVETLVSNATGSDAPLTIGATPSITGLHVGAAGANLATTGAWFGNNGGGGTQFDTGLYFNPGSIKSDTFVDDTSAVTSLFVAGAHSYGLNMGTATFSTAAIITPGFTVQPSGTISSAVTPTTAWTRDAVGSTVVIANGSNAAFPAGNGVIAVEDSVNSHSAIYLCSAGTCSLVSSAGPAWVAPTTTPASGHLSVDYSGTAYAIYNNEGASETITVDSLKLKATN